MSNRIITQSLISQSNKISRLQQDVIVLHEYDDNNDSRMNNIDYLLNNIDTELDKKANIISPNFQGIVTLSDPVYKSSSDNTVASVGLVKTMINDLIDGAPAALNTLNELANALNDDSNFSSTIINKINNSYTISDVDSELAKKQNVITENGLNINYVSGLQDALNERYTKNETDNILDQKATSHNPSFTGSVTIPRITDLTKNDDSVATTAFIQSKINNITGNIPTNLNTLEKIANTFDNDSLFLNKINEELGKRYTATDINTLLLNKQNLIGDGDLSISNVSNLNNILNNKYDKSYIDSILVTKATKENPEFTGIPTISGSIDSTKNDNSIATTAFVKTVVNDLINSSSSTLDTLNQLSVALNSDSSASSVIISGLSDRYTKSDVDQLLDNKQNKINDNELPIDKVNGLLTELSNRYTKFETDTELNKKQNIINDNELSIGKINNLRSELDNRYTKIITDNLLFGKQNKINDGDLSILKVDGLQSELNNRYYKIEVDQALSLKQDRIVNNSLNIDHVSDLKDNLDSKAPKNNPIFSGSVVVPQISDLSKNDNTVATTSFVQAKVNEIISGAPSTLNTLNEISTALGNDLNFSTTILNSLGDRYRKIEVDDLLLGKQNLITVGSLPLDRVNGLTDALNLKQDYIMDNGLAIRKVTGLQSILNNKQDKINPGDLDITYINGLEDALYTLETEKAPLDNPTFTGTVTVPSVNTSTNDNTVATTAFVKSVIASSVSSSGSGSETVSNNTTSLTNYYMKSEVNSLLDLKQNAISDTKQLPMSNISGLTTALMGKAPTVNPIFTGIVSGITKGMVGLSSVDNTSDLDKPISILTQSALNLKAPLTNPNFSGTVTGITKTMVGLSNVDNISDKDKPLSDASITALNLKAPKDNPIFTGIVQGINKTMVGLSNVDNTSDIDKPLSTAVTVELNKKASLTGSNFTGVVTIPEIVDKTINNNTVATTKFVHTLVGDLIQSSNTMLDTINSITSTLGSDSNAAGSILNALDQRYTKTEVDTKLDLKASLNDPNFTGTVTGIDKTMVGLSNVDNTSDINKPLSNATVTALDLKAPKENPIFTGIVSGIDKTMVGLSNVDNTSDLDKPISNATKTVLDLKAPLENPQFTGTVSGIEPWMIGLGNVNNTSDINKPISNATQTALDTKAPLNSPEFTGTVSGITKTMVGLSNVDNTSDLNKPISNAAQIVLDTKAPLESPHFTGTVSGITKEMIGLGNVENVANEDRGISNLTQVALNTKANSHEPQFTGTVRGITKDMVGLSNVNNTSDLNKPISNLTQTELNLKAPLTDPIFLSSVTLPQITDINSNSENAATTRFVKQNISNIIDSAPTSLNTLNKIATNLTNFTTDTTNSLNNRYTIAETDILLDTKASLAGCQFLGSVSVPEIVNLSLNDQSVATTNYVQTNLSNLKDNVSTDFNTLKKIEDNLILKATSDAPTFTNQATFNGHVQLNNTVSVNEVLDVNRDDQNVATTKYVKSNISNLLNGASSGYQTLKDIENNLKNLDTTRYTKDETDILLDTKASLSGSVFTGSVTVPDVDISLNDQTVATTKFVKSNIDNLIDNAPSNLNTLNKIVTALNNNSSGAFTELSNRYTIDQTDTLLNLKAPKNSPVFTGTSEFKGPVTIPSITGTSVNDNTVATTAFVKNVVADLVNGAPQTLDTLNEIATLLGNNSSFSGTIISGLADRYTKTETNSMLDLKAPKDHPTFDNLATFNGSVNLKGSVTVDEVLNVNRNDQNVATTKYVKSNIDNLIDGASSTSNTLKKLEDNINTLSTNTTASLNLKAPKDTPIFTNLATFNGPVSLKNSVTVDEVLNIDRNDQNVATTNYVKLNIDKLSTDTSNNLFLKAPKDTPTFTNLATFNGPVKLNNSVTVDEVLDVNKNDQNVATTKYVKSNITNLIDGATLNNNTLKKIEDNINSLTSYTINELSLRSTIDNPSFDNTATFNGPVRLKSTVTVDELLDVNKNDQNVATTKFVKSNITNLINGASINNNTLKKIETNINALSADTVASLNLKAPKDTPSFTNLATFDGPVQLNNPVTVLEVLDVNRDDQNVATTKYVKSNITNLINGASSTSNTLKKIEDNINSLSTNTTASLDLKAPKDTPTFINTATFNGPVKLNNTVTLDEVLDVNKNDQNVATTKYVKSNITNLVDGATVTSNTLKKIEDNINSLSADTSASLALKAPKDTPIFTNQATFQGPVKLNNTVILDEILDVSKNDQNVATTSFVKSNISNLINGATSASNTLKKIEDNINSLSSNTTASLALKAPLNAPTFTNLATFQGPVKLSNTVTVDEVLDITKNDQNVATTSFVKTNISNLINGASSNSNTLKKIEDNINSLTTATNNELALKSTSNAPTFTNQATFQGPVKLNNTVIVDEVLDLNKNDQNVATTSFVKSNITNLINGATSNNNTLKKIEDNINSLTSDTTTKLDNRYTKLDTDNLLSLKASLAGITQFTGQVLIPEIVDINTSNNSVATTAFVKNVVSNLVNSAPGTLDTLKEIADALGNDKNFSVSMTNSLNNRYTKAEADNLLSFKATKDTPTFTGTASFQGPVDVQGPTTYTSSVTVPQIADLNKSDEGVATTRFVKTNISNLVNNAPVELNTLKKISTALGDDPNFSTNTIASINSRYTKLETNTLLDTKQDYINNDSLPIIKVQGLQMALDSKLATTGSIGINQVTNLQTELNKKQNTITDNSLNISHTIGLQDALTGKLSVTGNLPINQVTDLQNQLNTKQNVIGDASLTIAKTANLQTELNNRISKTDSIPITQITNLQTTLNNKQNVINDSGLTISKTSGLQTALNNKYDRSEVDLLLINKQNNITIDNPIDIAYVNGLQTELNNRLQSSSTLPISQIIGLQSALNGKLSTSGTIPISQVINLQSAINSKQNTINDDDLTIAKVSGLQTALTGKYDKTEVNTLLNTKQNTIADGGLTISKTATLQSELDKRYTKTETDSLLTLKAPLSNPTFTGSVNIPTILDTSSNDTNAASTGFVRSVVNEVIDSAPITLNTLKKLSDAIGSNANFSTSMTNSLNNRYTKTETDSLLASKQNSITNNSLNIAHTLGLQTALDNKLEKTGNIAISQVTNLQTTLNSKQDTIADNSLPLGKITGLQTALDSKLSSSSNIPISQVTNLQTTLDNKQNIITDNSLTIARTNGLQSALDSKYDKTSVNALLDTKQDKITITNPLNVSQVGGLQTSLDNRYIKTDVDTLLAIKAPSFNPTFTGIVTVPTILDSQSNDDNAASTKFVQNVVSNLVGNAPTALNTLKELSDALGNDANFASSVTNSLNARYTKSETDSLLASKQNNITNNSLNIAHTIGLQNTLDNKLEKTGNIPISQVTNLQTSLSGKQDLIADNSLPIVKIVGLQTVLDGKLSSAANIPISQVTNLQTTLNEKQNTITDNSLTIAKTNGLQTALDDRYTKTSINTLLSNKQNLITTTNPLNISQIDGLQTTLDNKYNKSEVDASLLLKAQLDNPVFRGSVSVPTILDIGSNDDNAASTKFVQNAINNIVGGAPIALNTLKELSDAIGGDPNFSVSVINGLNERYTKTAVNSLLDTKQNSITNNSLAISHTIGLQSALDAKLGKTENIPITQITNLQTALTGKQDVIADNSLSITKVTGLQTALDAKLGSLTNIPIMQVTNLQTSLDGKQNIITDNSLTIARTNGLQTALNDRYTKTAVDTLLTSKQDLITTTNPLSISQINGLQTSLTNKYDKTVIDPILDSKAPLSNPVFTGSVTVPTITDTSSNNDNAASTKFVQNVVSNLVGSAPIALDTLKELSDALGNDANFASTVTNSLSNRYTKTEVDTRLATKQNSITDNSLNISHTIGLQTALDAKQNIITDNSLTISRTAGLQTALDNRYTKTAVDTLLTSKQNNITVNSLDITHTNGLQTALDTKLGKTENIPISQVTNLQTSLTGKQDVIADNSLPIVKVTGLQTALDAKLGSSTNIPVSQVTNLQTTLDGKQNIITDNSLTIARTNGLQTALNDRYTKTAVDTLLTSKQDLITTTNPLSISQINGLQTSLTNKYDKTVIDPILDSKAPLSNPVFTGSVTVPTITDTSSNDDNAASTKFVQNVVSNLVGSAPIALDTLKELSDALGNDANFASTVTNSLSNRYTKTEVDTRLATKQNSITDNSLNISHTIGLQTALNAKQNVITDNSLTIARTNGLQTALDNRYTKTAVDTLLTSKQDNITINSLDITHTNGLQTALDAKLGKTENIPISQVTNLQTTLIGKQDVIADNSLPIVKVSGLQTALDAKLGSSTNIPISQVTNLQTTLDEKQNTITDNSLSIARTNGLQTALNDRYTKTAVDTLLTSKQDLITTTNPLSISQINGLQTSLTNKYDKTVIDPILNSKAPSNNPVFTGSVTVPTITDTSSNNDNAASTKFVQNVVSNLVGSAPIALDTLKELSDALGNDANFASTVTNSLNNRYTKTEVDTRLATKHNSITDNSLNISHTIGLQTALDTKLGKIENIPMSQVTDLQTTLSEKQDVIADNSLPIVKVTGLQTVLDGKLGSSTNIPISQVTNLQTSLDGKQNVITDSSLTIARTNGLQTALNERYTKTAVDTLLTSKQDLITTTNPLSISQMSGLQASLDAKQNIITDNSLTIGRTNGLQTALDNRYTKIAVDTLLTLKQDTITNNSLDISHTNGLQTALDTKLGKIENIPISQVTNLQTALTEKQDVIADNSLPIVKVTGLQTALDTKLGSSTNIPISQVTNLQITLDGKQNTITDNSLSIARTNGLQTALNDRYTKTAVDTLLTSKQDLITTTNPLSISQINGLQTSLTNKYDKTVIDPILDSKAPSNNPVFTGSVTVPTITDTSTNDDNAASTKFVQNVVSNIVGIVGSASTALDTLKELSDALGNDANFASTVTNSLNNRYTKTEVDTRLATKQNSITDNSLNISHTIGLQTALDTKLGKIENIPISQVTDLQTTLSGKQDVIADNSLPIVKVTGLQTVLDGKLGTSTDIPISQVTNLQTSLDGKQNVITDSSLTIARTNGLQTALNERYTKTAVDTLLTSKQDLITTTNPLSISQMSGLQASLDAKQNIITDNSLTIGRTNGLQTALDNRYTKIAVDTILTSKQDTITSNSLIIAHTNGLQTALDTKLGKIENIPISQVTNLQTALTGKQDVIADNSLPIVKVSGLQTALDTKLGSSTNIPISQVTNLQTTLDEKQNTITDNSLTIARTNGLQTALNDRYTKTAVDTLLLSKQDLITTTNPLSISQINGLQTSLTNKYDKTVIDPILNSKAPSNNPVFTGSVTVPTITDSNSNDDNAASTKFVQNVVSNLVGSAPIALDTLKELSDALGNDANFASTVTNSLSNRYTKTEVDTRLATKQNSITDNSLNISNTIGLQTALDTKQNTITDNSLTIARTAGLQTALDNRYTKTAVETLLTSKQDTITNNSLIISHTNGLQMALDAKLGKTENIPISQVTNLQTTLIGKQDVIADNSLPIVKVTGLQTALDGKLGTSTNIPISQVTNLQTTLDGKQNTIVDNSLIISNTTGLQSALDNRYTKTVVDTMINTKQDKITSTNLLDMSLISGLQTSLTNKYDKTVIDPILTSKAPLNNPIFTGSVIVPTVLDTSSNDNNAASTKFVQNVVSNLINGAPTALNTLNELATALGSDANFSTTITNSLSNRYTKSEVDTFINSKQDKITNTSQLPISNISGLQSALDLKLDNTGLIPISQVTNLQSKLDEKQNIILDGGLTIAKTANLQSVLNSKMNSDAQIPITQITNLQTTLDGKQASITNGSLTIARTANLQTELDRRYIKDDIDTLLLGKQNNISDTNQLQMSNIGGLQNALENRYTKSETNSMLQTVQTLVKSPVSLCSTTNIDLNIVPIIKWTSNTTKTTSVTQQLITYVSSTTSPLADAQGNTIDPLKYNNYVSFASSFRITQNNTNNSVMAIAIGFNGNSDLIRINDYNTLGYFQVVAVSGGDIINVNYAYPSVFNINKDIYYLIKVTNLQLSISFYTRDANNVYTVLSTTTNQTVATGTLRGNFSNNLATQNRLSDLFIYGYSPLVIGPAGISNANVTIDALLSTLNVLPISVDGIFPLVNQRILLTGQTDQKQNGVWKVPTYGTTLFRPTDFATNSNAGSNIIIVNGNGLTNNSTAFYCTSPSGFDVVDIHPLTWDYAMNQSKYSSLLDFTNTKSPIDNPTFTGSVTLPSIDVNTTNNNLAATTGYVKTSITNLVNSAPATLDTLSEIATALGNDPNLATTLTTQMGLRAPINNPTFTGTVSGITKTMVGLNNVDNTTDVNKPVSTATQTALDTKLNLTGGTLTGGLTGTTANFSGPITANGGTFTGSVTMNFSLNVLGSITANLPNYNTNLDAFNAGVPYMGLYRTGGIVKVRLDIVPPTITLLGASSVSLNMGSTYTEPGVTVTDNYDTNLPCYITSISSGSTNALSNSITVVGTTTTVSQTSTLPVGVYTITYNAYDSSGNIGLNTRMLNIIDTVRKIYYSSSTLLQTIAFYATYGTFTQIQSTPIVINNYNSGNYTNWGFASDYFNDLSLFNPNTPWYCVFKMKWEIADGLNYSFGHSYTSWGNNYEPSNYYTIGFSMDQHGISSNRGFPMISLPTNFFTAIHSDHYFIITRNLNNTLTLKWQDINGTVLLTYTTSSTITYAAKTILWGMYGNTGAPPGAILYSGFVLENTTSPASYLNWNAVFG